MTYCLFLLTCSQFMGEDRPGVSPGEPVTEDELRKLARQLWGHTDQPPAPPMPADHEVLAAVDGAPEAVHVIVKAEGVDGA